MKKVLGYAMLGVLFALFTAWLIVVYGVPPVLIAYGIVLVLAAFLGTAIWLITYD